MGWGFIIIRSFRGVDKFLVSPFLFGIIDSRVEKRRLAWLITKRSGFNSRPCNTMKETYKRYLVSSLVTFLTGFALAVIPDIDKISLDSFQDGVFVGIVFAGARAGMKALLEMFARR